MVTLLHARHIILLVINDDTTHELAGHDRILTLVRHELALRRLLLHLIRHR